MNKTNSTSLRIKLIYALGQYGWSLCAYSVTMLLSTFYFPPETDNQYNFPEFISTKMFFGFLTILGLLTFGGRLFDAIIDPIIANKSDNYKGKLGKRRSFLLFSALPFALFSILVFIPVSQDSSLLNSIWLLFTLFGFFFFMTCYTVPYTAWMSELGKSQKERLNISTMISVTWALGFASGNFIHLLINYLERFYSLIPAFQISVAILSTISLIFMLLPAIFIDEKKYSIDIKSDLSTRTSLKMVLKDSNFKKFVLSDLFYWMALTSIQTGIVYYVTVLLQQEKQKITEYMTWMFVLSFALYYPVNYLSKKFGRKLLINIAFVIFMILFMGIFFIDVNTPISLFYLLILSAALPMAVFGILPNAIIADIANDDFQNTNENKAAMFFAVRMFMMKIGIAFTGLVFPTLLALGKSTHNDIGIRLTAIFAFLASVIGLIIFQKYKQSIEKK